MRDSELYEKILGLFEPWHVEEVAVDRKRLEVVIRVGLRGSVVLVCPECGEAMSMPSMSSSPRIRGAPHVGFSIDIRRMRSRISFGTCGRPGFLLLHLQ